MRTIVVFNYGDKVPDDARPIGVAPEFIRGPGGEQMQQLQFYYDIPTKPEGEVCPSKEKVFSKQKSGKT